MTRARCAVPALLLALTGATFAGEIYPTPDDPIPGDIDGDGAVTFGEVITVYNAIGTPGRVLFKDGDVDRDGDIDVDDYDIAAANFGQSLAPIPLASGVSLHATGSTLPSDGPLTGLSLGDIDDLDASNNPVRIFRDVSLVEATGWAPGIVNTLTPTISAKWRADGVDLTVAYANTTNDPMHPAALRIPVFDRSMTPKYRDMSRGGMAREFSYSGSGNGNAGSLLGYPGVMYAPATVIENHADGYAVGISVQYPVLEYKHPVYFWAKDTVNNADSDVDGMMVYFLLNPDTDDDPVATSLYKPEYNVPPNEVRIYTISLRVRAIDFATADEGEWMHTLRPYRRWFRYMYGGVRYQRNPEQVLFSGLVNTGIQSSMANPYRFSDPANPSLQRRPDIYGFGRWRASWDTSAANGWQRIMVWGPTGLYASNAFNYPSHFTSKWPDILSHVDTSNYDNTLGPLAGFTGSVQDASLGLWWGNSSEIPVDGSTPSNIVTWEPAASEIYDSTLSKHVNFREDELAGAENVNAVEIGLDDFAQGGRWERYWTLIEDIAAHPSLRFITEPAMGDFLNTLAPNYVIATRKPSLNGGEIYYFPQGLPIIDFLMPGHETWGHLDHTHVGWDLDPTDGLPLPNAAAITPYINDIAGFGFVPVVAGALPAETLTTDFDAEETWLNTVPLDLQ